MARILVIEDNATNLKLTLTLLATAGHSTLHTADAESGLALARSQKPDLILMDIQLPGMDGLAATALLKADAATRSIPVIAITALAMKGDEVRIRRAGCNGYVSKPLDYRKFLAVVATHLKPAPAGGHAWQAS